MSEDTLSLELNLREVTGKKVKTLRANGTVPAVIHDHGKPSINVEAPYLAIYRTYLHAGKHHPVQLTAGDKKFTALIKSATFEPKKNMLTHVVFNAVNRNQKVEAEVPIHPRYAEGEEASPAELKSLIVLDQLASIEVRAIPDKIPDVLYYDAQKLVEDGDSVAVRDLEIPEGVEIEEEMLDHPVATVTTTAALEAANAAIAGEEEEKPAAETAEGESTEAAAESTETKPEEEK
ncbi:MAG TPA: 50S ribosomal protein L25 [Verrucomicrobiae bacterium]|nr:50S ribosomal protein L25 [Verrucomicrobiae bacterium]